MTVKCRGFEGELLSLDAASIGKDIYDIVYIEVCTNKFMRKQGKSLRFSA